MPNKRVGYRLCASIKEAHGHPIYCAAFSPASHHHSDNGGDDNSNDCLKGGDDNSNDCLKYFATCAGPYASIYEVGSSTVISNVNKQSERSIRVRQVYCDVDKEEQFYACAFGGRGVSEGKTNNNVATSSSSSSSSSNNRAISIGDDNKTQSGSRKRQRPNDDKNSSYDDLSQRQGPPLLCVAGKRGIIKVIDTVLQSLVNTLLGHGDTVNDLKCSPTNEWLLLSASKDHSIRLWNLQHGQMIAIYHGHRGQVLSLSWHHSGTKFASSAHDATVKLWKVFDDPTTAATTESESTNGKKEGHVEAAIRKSFEMVQFRTAIEQAPFFSTDSIHQLPGIVDCVQFVGDLILSKSVHNVVVLWKPVVTSEDSASFNTIYPNLINDESNSDDMIPSKVIFLRNFTVEKCDSWFIRFHSPLPYNEVLALGNHKGEIKVWRLMGSENDEENDEDLLSEDLLCKLKTGDSTCRNITFAGKECFVAVCDDTSVWAFEAKE